MTNRLYVIALVLLLAGLGCLHQGRSQTLPLLGAGKGAPLSSCVAPNLTNNWGWWAAVNSYTETSGTPTTLITVDGTTVGSQLDLGGSGNHLYINIGPAYKTNILNSLPAARYGGVQSMSTTVAPSGNSFSIFAVANQTVNNTNYDGFVTNNDPVLNPRYSLMNSGGGANMGVGNGAFFAGGAIAAFSATTYHLIAATIDNTGSFPTSLQIDGNSNVTANAIGNGGLGTQLTVGQFFNGSWTGDVLEIIFNLAVQPPNTGAGLCNRQYLNSRYNLGLTVS